jgi:hypothetical protein
MVISSDKLTMKKAEKRENSTEGRAVFLFKILNRKHKKLRIKPSR